MKNELVDRPGKLALAVQSVERIERGATEEESTRRGFLLFSRHASIVRGSGSGESAAWRPNGDPRRCRDARCSPS